MRGRERGPLASDVDPAEGFPEPGAGEGAVLRPSPLT